MKRTMVAAALAVGLLSPAMAFAGGATNAALGLGAFAVFNQILSGTGIFGGYNAPVAPVVVAPPPLVVVAPAPVVVAPPPAVVVAPAPPVTYYTPPSVYYPAPAYYPVRSYHPPARVYYAPHRPAGPGWHAPVPVRHGRGY